MNRVLLSLVVLAAISCGGSDLRARHDGQARRIRLRSKRGASARQAVAPIAPGPPRIVALGDSLTAGLGIPREQAYPAVLQRKLQDAGIPLEVVNAGVSGDTSADGLRRANWALEGDVRLLILALGANDGLRGLPPAQMKDKSAEHHPSRAAAGDSGAARRHGSAAELRGTIRGGISSGVSDLARENKVTLVPFLLEGVAGVPDLNQADGIHPTSAGAARIADHLWPAVETMIEK